MIKYLTVEFSPQSRLELVMGVDTFMFLRIVASPETLDGQNKSDESWTWVLIMCLEGSNLAG
jgi:hypothetical protein